MQTALRKGNKTIGGERIMDDFIKEFEEFRSKLFRVDAAMPLYEVVKLFKIYKQEQWMKYIESSKNERQLYDKHGIVFR